MVIRSEVRSMVTVVIPSIFILFSILKMRTFKTILTKVTTRNSRAEGNCRLWRNPATLRLLEDKNQSFKKNAAHWVVAKNHDFHYCTFKKECQAGYAFLYSPQTNERITIYKLCYLLTTLVHRTRISMNNNNMATIWHGKTWYLYNGCKFRYIQVLWT